jgi:4-amino-4-deoxy-L-arabinose transferase-like glycosyltransferase
LKGRFGSIVIPALLVLFAAALYLPRLRDTPLYVTPDEVFSALTAHSVATTGRDLNGRFMPLYFQLPDSFETRMWYQPVVVYAIAASLKILPFSEAAIRLPAALAAILDVLLAYCVARVLFRNEAVAVAAGVLLALTPAHFADSRVAMDHHAFLPFILGWLLCLLMYLERNKPSFLFAAGLVLGVGLFTYIASYAFMPLYLALTCVVLFRRKEALARYGVLAAGFLIPVLVGAAFVAVHPDVIGDTLWRYQRDKPQTAGSVTLLRGFLGFDRIARAASVYWSFWQPRLLFVNGPRSVWVAGQFLIPIAGLFVAGTLRTLRRPDAILMVILAGLLIAPIPASIVGEPEVIRRAAAVMPFGVLFAVAGLDYLWTAETPTTRRVVFVLMWAAVIVIAAVYHDDLPHAQALVRAATVPLAVTGLAVLVDPGALRRLRMPQVALVALAVIAATHLAYALRDEAVTGGVILLAAISLAALFEHQPALLNRRPLAVVGLIAFAAAHFMYVYVDYGQPQRVGRIPASLVILASRVIVSSVAVLAAILAASRLAARPSAAAKASAEQVLARSEPVEPRAGRHGWLVPFWLVGTQLAYFAIDHYSGVGFRAAYAAVMLVSAFGLAALVRGGLHSRVGLGPIALAGLLTVAVMQFTPFYRDYFAGFRARGNPQPASARVAFEPVIARTADRPVPAIYLGWPYALGDLYWEFYLIKHHREDLRSRTIAELDFKPERIRELPAGSLVVTSSSPHIDAAIDDMTKRGELAARALIKDADGTPIFWILEAAGPRAHAPRG